MRRPLLALALVTACARPSSSPVPPSSPTAPRVSVAVAHASAPTDTSRREADDDLRAVSPFADTVDGARAFVTELAQAARSTEHARWDRITRELIPDARRYELGLSFEGARRTREQVLDGLPARARDLRARLAAMREPLTFTAVSALGAAFADGASHGFPDAIGHARDFVRPAVRYVRVDVTDADGQRMSIQALAFLAARWTWLGDFWDELPATTPPPSPSPPASSGAPLSHATVR